MMVKIYVGESDTTMWYDELLYGWRLSGTWHYSLGWYMGWGEGKVVKGKKLKV